MGSRLFVMIPYNSAAYIYKSIPAISANDCFFARFSTQGRRTDTTSDRFSDMVSLNYSTGGNVDPANRLYVYTATTGSAFSFKTQYGRTAAGADGNALITSGVSTIGDIRGIRNVGANNWAPFTLDSTNGKMEAPYAYTGLTTASVVLFALTVDATNQSTVGNWVPYMWAIDFARRTAGTGTAFVAQTPRPVAWNVVNADITNYSSKATPVAADQVYIADSAASNAIKRATLATAVTGTFAKGLVYRNAALNSHNTSVFAKVALDTVSFDTAGIWNAANTRFIPNQPGYYLVSVRLRRATSGLFAAGIGKNGSPFQAVGGDIGTADVGLAAGGSEIVFCNGTTDYIEAFAFSANTIAYSAVGNIFDNWMSIVGPF
jgi:hypothetical protein